MDPIYMSENAFVSTCYCLLEQKFMQAIQNM